MRPQPTTETEYEELVAAYEAYQAGRLAETRRRFDGVDALRENALAVLRDSLDGVLYSDAMVAAAAFVVEHTAEVPWDGPEWPNRPPKPEDEEGDDDPES